MSATKTPAWLVSDSERDAYVGQIVVTESGGQARVTHTKKRGNTVVITGIAPLKRP